MAAEDEKSSEQLNALIEISRAVTTHLDLPEVLSSVLSLATDVLNAEASSIAQTEESTGDILFHVTRGEGGDAIKTLRLKAGEGIIGAVIDSGEPELVNDVSSDARFFKEADDKSGFQTRSILCVPMRTPNGILGAVEVMNKKGGSQCFTDDDLMLCSAIASQAAIAIENAELHRKAVESERLAAIGQAIAGTAHCIKNVLNGIQGGAYMVDSGLAKDKPETVGRGWEIVKKNNTFMQELVLDMLTYSKERVPEYASCDANEVLQSVCDMISEKASDNGVAVQCIKGDLPGDADLDAKGIRRCLLNLLSNAVDASAGEDGKVTAESMCIDGEQPLLRLVVADNGCGISEEAMGKLFKVFFSTKGNKGTGLGLAVTKKIIEEHGGTITVSSEEGVGTAFTIDLPFKRAIRSADE